jgi:hypothetical protein
MKLTRLAIAKVSNCLLESGAKKATLYLANDFVVKATMGLKRRKNERSHSFLITFGRPNYAERKFLAACIKAHEPIPVRKVQLKFFKK